MFKHHKYCVIEVSGLLVATEDSDGVLTVYLLDHTHGPTPMDGLSSAGDKSGMVRITDPGLIEFIGRELPWHEGERTLSCKVHSCQARVAGTVDMDGGEVQLSYVSQAIVVDRERLLKYEPQ